MKTVHAIKVLKRILDYIAVERFRCSFCSKVVINPPKSEAGECEYSPNGRHNWLVVHR
mgnify:FL=1